VDSTTNIYKVKVGYSWDQSMRSEKSTFPRAHVNEPFKFTEIFCKIFFETGLYFVTGGVFEKRGVICAD
jgi:hypothetical protein